MPRFYKSSITFEIQSIKPLMRNDDQNNIINLHTYIKNKRKINSIDCFSIAITNEKILAKRISAFVIDLFTIILLKTAIDVSYAIFLNNFYFFLNLQQQNTLSSGNLPMHWTITMIIFWTYFIYCHYTLEGKTFGKMAMKIRTINDEFIFIQKFKDYTPTLKMAFRRTLGYFVCYLSFGTFFGFSFFSEDQRGVPDYFSSSRTVSDEWLHSMINFKEYQAEIIYIDIKSLKKVA